MTSAKTIPNIIFDEGGTNEITFYTASCEKIYSKKMTGVTAPQSTANYESGPKDTKIVDLLRIEIRFTGIGYIDSADEDKIENLMTQGGVFNMKWKGTNHSVNFEKLSILDNNQTENDETKITFTALVGVNFSSG